MATYDSGTSTALYVPPTWVRVLLGIVLILGGFSVLGDVVLATLISTLLIGVTAIVVGAFEIVHAFWTKGWGGFIWQILLGALYVIFGWMVINQPVSGALVLTYVIAMVFLASGIVRIVVAFRHWSEAGWLMLISGAFGVLAGLIILSKCRLADLRVVAFSTTFRAVGIASSFGQRALCKRAKLA